MCYIIIKDHAASTTCGWHADVTKCQHACPSAHTRVDCQSHKAAERAFAILNMMLCIHGSVNCMPVTGQSDLLMHWLQQQRPLRLQLTKLPELAQLGDARAINHLTADFKLPGCTLGSCCSSQWDHGMHSAGSTWQQATRHALCNSSLQQWQRRHLARWMACLAPYQASSRLHDVD